ncbi:hypothetical protein STEG23_004143 [Scotinomys teguina]
MKSWQLIAVVGDALQKRQCLKDGVGASAFPPFACFNRSASFAVGMYAYPQIGISAHQKILLLRIQAQE